MFNKGNNSVLTSCSGSSFVEGFNGDENMLGNKYSEIPDINTAGNMVWNQVDSGSIVWHQVQRGIPEAGVLSQYSKMADIIGDKGSLIQASRRTLMPT